MKKYRVLFFAVFLFIFRLHPVHAQVTLNLKFFIQGYYTSSGLMKPVLYYELVSGAMLWQTDTVEVQLRSTVSPYLPVELFRGIVNTDGTMACSFTNAVNGSSYYIVVKHRSMVETWSALPVMMMTNANYDFTTSASSAYGNNMLLETGGVWVFYNGDIDQNRNTDLIDFPPLDFGINLGLYGYYKSDLNGDGNVDVFDFIILDNNINMGVFARHP